MRFCKISYRIRFINYILKGTKIMSTLEELETHLNSIGVDVDSLLVTVQELKDALANVGIPAEVQAKIDELVAKATAIDEKVPVA